MCDSRALRMTKACLGPLAAAAFGITSTGALAAMPAAISGPQTPRLILVQQSPAGRQAAEPSRDTAGEQTAPDSFNELHEALAAARERLDELSRAAEAVAATGELQRELAAARQQNQQLRAQIEALQGERDELNAAREAAEARAAEASRAAEEATATAKEIDEELVAVRWQNAQLNTSLVQARAKRDELSTEVDVLRASIEELQAGTATATAATVRLRAQLDEQEHRTEAAASAQAEAERQLAEWRDRARLAEQERANAGERLAAVETELATLNEQLASAERERTQAAERTAALEDERDELRDHLTSLTQRLVQAETANGQLERRIIELREAAGTATEMARQNLIAVEDRIRRLNEVLDATGPAGGPFETDPSQSGRTGEFGSVEEASTGAITTATPDGARVASQGTEAPPSRPDTDSIVSAAAADRPAEANIAPMLNDLPLEKRLQVHGLLADLDAKVGEQGLKTVVPGALLFAVNSEEVQEGAHDTLSKVAELISVYDDRKVLIVGHTDAVGDAAYNKQLSERRAELVKRFFVDNFDLEEARLSTQGLGEERPIASDATPEGRRANRRVEVLILD